MHMKPQNRPSKDLNLLIRPFVRLGDLDDDSLQIAARGVVFLVTLTNRIAYCFVVKLHGSTRCQFSFNGSRDAIGGRCHDSFGSHRLFGVGACHHRILHERHRSFEDRRHSQQPCLPYLWCWTWPCPRLATSCGTAAGQCFEALASHQKR